MDRAFFNQVVGNSNYRDYFLELMNMDLIFSIWEESNIFSKFKYIEHTWGNDRSAHYNNKRMNKAFSIIDT